MQSVRVKWTPNSEGQQPLYNGQSNPEVRRESWCVKELYYVVILSPLSNFYPVKYGFVRLFASKGLYVKHGYFVIDVI